MRYGSFWIVRQRRLWRLSYAKLRMEDAANVKNSHALPALLLLLLCAAGFELCYRAQKRRLFRRHPKLRGVPLAAPLRADRR